MRICTDDEIAPFCKPRKKPIKEKGAFHSKNKKARLYNQAFNIVGLPDWQGW